ncbi:MAG: tetratricopeptide repeat protein [Minicystis sp.]
MPHAPWLRAALLALAVSSPLVAAEAHALPPKPAGATPDDASVKKATAFFVKGSEFYDKSRFALALEQFKQSYAVVPSPNSRFYIARCLAALGDHREAYREYNGVIAEVDARGPGDTKYAKTRDTARQERDDLNAKVALVTITPPAAKLDITVRVGGELVPREQWSTPLPVKPGLVPVEIQIGNQAAAGQSLTLSAGERRAIVLDDTPAVQAATAKANGTDKPRDTGSGSLMRPLAYAAGGVGVLGMVMFAVAGSMSKSTYSSLEEKCGQGPCPSNLQSDISKGKTQQLVANVGLGVGLVGLAAGTTLFLLAPSGKKGDAAPRKAGAHLELGAGYMGVAGQF